MKRNIFFLKSDRVIYNNQSYNIDSLIEDVKLPKQMVIYILEEDLFINEYLFDSRINIKQDVDKFIHNIFGVNKDYLFDYKVDFKNKIANIYTIKGGNRVNKICRNVSDLKVIPVQFEILRKVKRRIIDKNYELIYLYEGCYYFLKVDNNNLKKSVVKYSLEDVKNLIDVDCENLIYIDSKIVDLDIKNKKIIQLGGILDEKI